MLMDRKVSMQREFATFHRKPATRQRKFTLFWGSDAPESLCLEVDLIPDFAVPCLGSPGMVERDVAG